MPVDSLVGEQGCQLSWRPACWPLAGGHYSRCEHRLHPEKAKDSRPFPDLISCLPPPCHSPIFVNWPLRVWVGVEAHFLSLAFFRINSLDFECWSVDVGRAGGWVGVGLVS